jgi:hypothetical protein
LRKIAKKRYNKNVINWRLKMGEVIFSFKVEIGYEPGRGVEVRLKHKGLVSEKVRRHLTRAGKELSMALTLLAGPEVKSRTGVTKKRQKIEIKEA